MQKDNLSDKRIAMREVFLKLIAMVFFLTVTTSPALAHNVNIFAYVEGDSTESYFNDGKRCVHSKIVVFDSTGKQLLEGVTNNEGEFSFVASTKTDLRIVLTAAMGHKSEYLLPASEFSEPREEQKKMNKGDVFRKEIPLPRNEKNRVGATSGKNSLDVKAIQALIEASVDKKLEPLMKSLIRIEQSLKKPSHTEVIGGIGYIFGIVGIVMYLRNRKR